MSHPTHRGAALLGGLIVAAAIGCGGPPDPGRGAGTGPIAPDEAGPLLQEPPASRKTDSLADPAPLSVHPPDGADRSPETPAAGLDTSAGTPGTAPPGDHGDGKPEGEGPIVGTDENATSPDVVAGDPPAARGRDPEAFRVLLLAPRRPIVGEVLVAVDGRTVEDGLTAATEAMLLRLANEQDVPIPLWEPALASGLLDPPGPRPADEADRMASRADLNRNGRVEADELRRYLTRELGNRTGFSVVSFNTYRERNRDDSRLWQTLDADGNGRLDRFEWDEARDRLIAWDADRDGSLRLAELPGGRGRPPSDRVRVAAPPTVLPISELTDWDLLAANLGERYAFGGALTPDDVALWPGEDAPPGDAATADEMTTATSPEDPDAPLDGDGNGRIATSELASGLSRVTPRFRLTVAFGAAAEDGSAAPAALTVASLDPPGGPTPPADRPTVTASGPHARVTWPGELLLLVRVADALPRRDVTAEVETLFRQLDADGDGVVTVEEVSAAGGPPGPRTTARDTDGDGMITRAEWAESIRLTVADRPYQVRLTCAEHEDILLPWVDTDGNGVLSTRELAALPDRLAGLDHDGDGLLRIDQMPECLTMLVERGPAAPPVRPPLARFGPLTVASDVTPPAWFAAMDTNGDADIDRREFLGPASAFDRIDADGDGFLTVDEAVRAAEEATSPGP